MVAASVMYAVPTALVSLFMGILFAVSEEDLLPKKMIFLTLSLLSMSLTFAIIGEHGSMASAGYQLMRVTSWLVYIFIFLFVINFFVWLMQNIGSGKK